VCSVSTFEGAAGQALGRYGHRKDDRSDLRMILAVNIDGDALRHAARREYRWRCASTCRPASRLRSIFTDEPVWLFSMILGFSRLVRAGQFCAVTSPLGSDLRDAGPLRLHKDGVIGERIVVARRPQAMLTLQANVDVWRGERAQAAEVPELTPAHRRVGMSGMPGYLSHSFIVTPFQRNPLRNTTQERGQMVDQTTALAKLKAQASLHVPDRHQIWNMSVVQAITT
jgi:hypothetical protein